VNEFLSAVVEILAGNDLIRFALTLSLSLFVSSSMFRVLSLVLFGDETSLTVFLFHLVWDGLKYCVATVLRFFRCFRLLYKLGLAEEGRDFVNCGDYECCSCPFGDKCPDNLSRKEVDSDA